MCDSLSVSLEDQMFQLELEAMALEFTNEYAQGSREHEMTWEQMVKFALENQS